VNDGNQGEETLTADGTLGPLVMSHGNTNELEGQQERKRGQKSSRQVFCCEEIGDTDGN
jgi:hypothetical protein